MVGLTELGEIAYDVEKIHNRLLEEERPVTASVLAMIDRAQASFRDWVDALSTTGRAKPDPAALHDAIRLVESELPGAGSVIGSLPAAPQLVVASATVTVETPPANAEQAEPQHAEPEPEPEPVSAAPVDGPHELADVIELPELGFGASESPTVEVEEQETIDFDELPSLEPHAPALKLVADNPRPFAASPLPPLHPAPSLREVAVSAPASARAESPDAGDAFPAVEAAPATPASLAPDEAIPVPEEAGPPTLGDAAIPATADEPVFASASDSAHVVTDEETPVEAVAALGDMPESDNVAIGDVTLPASLHRILVDEARQHLATLEHDLGVLQFDPHVPPSAAMVRAAHTLCGIHRTGGFELVAATSKSLELALIALQQRGAPLPGAALPVLARAVAGLNALVGRIERRMPFEPGDDAEGREVQEELDALRQDATADADVDAETAAAHAAARDDEHAALDSEPGADETVTVPRAEELKTDLTGIQDEVDAELVAIFLEEAAELFPAAGEQLRAWRRSPADDVFAQQLRRTLHTFKGSARMAGAMRLGELTHVMESRLLAGESLADATPELFEALDTDLDRIAYVLDRLREGEVNVALPWVESLEPGPAPEVIVPEEAAAASATGAPAAPATAAPAPVEHAQARVDERPVVVPFVPPAAPVHVEPAPVVAAPARESPPAPMAEPAPAVAVASTLAAPAMASRAELHEGEGPRAMLRVRADVVDRLVNEAGEVAITRARIEGELRALKNNLLELTGSVIRLRNQVREIEIQAETQIQSHMTQMQEHQGDYDPLEFDRFTRFQELTRSLAEGVNDVSTVQQSLLRNLDDADAALLAQARLSRDVQQQLFSIRTVPFGSLSERLYRIVRAVAKDLDKRANLEIAGGQTELDRSVLEKLSGPLEHLLRNAIDHGIEARDARRAAGKPETGEILLTVRQSGNEIVIELVDDGAGIDLSRIAEKARAQGLLAGDAKPTDAQLLDLIFRPGFSTASRVTQISGRGVGMDVVRSEIAALGGRVEVATRAGRGSTFTLALPLTLAVAQAVLVRAGGRLWALPAPMVEQVQQVKAEALLSLYVQRSVDWQSRSYPFHYLPRLLGDLSHNPETGRYNPVLLLRSGAACAAIHVDEMVGNQEIVVKNIGPQLARVSGISGATVLGSGEIVLIINPVQLAQRPDLPTFDPNAEVQVVRAAPAPAAESQPTVMVVDDSLTVRKITSRLLVREGFRVATAKDGLDALQAVADETPDLILLDIEMPRMDGFEFTKTIKGDPRTARIPIIMITSRTADKHRNRAAELGVDLYVGKPYQEDELIRNLREMLGMAAPA
jgi:chemosensory pili system protein ChpA (sensor histidine kinase/response regulator)